MKNNNWHYLVESYLNEDGKRYSWKKLKKEKVKLTPEERKQAMDAKCVWHFNGGSPSCAIWKSVDKKTGEVLYGCNTHRASCIKPTLKGAIAGFPFIKSTS